jgi:hypothetical protein
VGLRIGAIWALIGFAVQCVIAILTHASLQEGLSKALVHYFLWGAVGFLVGTVAQRAIEDSFQKMARQRQARAETGESETSQ